MTTEAQTEANRANAQKSTGPRTPEGKDTPRAPLRATAAQNALKHGLFAREGAIRGEDEWEFQEHRENLLRQLIPGTPLEEILADRVVDLSWRLKRAARDQEKAFVVLYGKQTAGLASSTGIPSASLSGQALPVDSNHGQDGDPKRDVSRLGTHAHATKRDATIGWMIVEDFNGEAVLDRLLRYERRIESSMYRALNELRRVHDQAQEAKQETLETRERWKEEDWEAKKTRPFRPCPPEEPGSIAQDAVREPVPSAGSGQALSLPKERTTHSADAQAGGQMCKTNPISEEVGRGRPTYEETPGRLPVQTNPILPIADCGLQIADCAKQTQFPAGPGGAGPEERGARSEMCKTNPIGGSPRSTGILPVNPNHGQDGDPKRDVSRLGTHAHATGYTPIFRRRR